MLWVAGALVAVILLFVVAVRSPLPRTLAMTRKALRARARRDWATAADLCRASHDLAGTLKEPNRSRIEAAIEIEWAATLYRQASLRQAEDLFRRGFSKSRAAGTHADQATAYMLWGDLCADEGRYPEAEQHYRTALDAKEERGDLGRMIFALQRLGDVLIRRERRAEAEEALNRALELEARVVQNNAISWVLPDLHFCREEYEDARRLYREKVEFWQKSAKRPEDIELGHLQMRLGIAEARTGHPAEAIEMFTRAQATFEREWCSAHPKAAAARAAKSQIVLAGGEALASHA
jgi:tetratricopeptide (TPR) repeat protein